MKNNNPIVPAKIYPNSDTDKLQILLDNKAKSGVYLWRNLVNEKKYIGSSVDLKRRFQEYFNVNHLTTYNYMNICRALLKHGYSNFSLEILEYCPAELLLEKEKYYFNLINPEYNICSDPAAPMYGRKHSDETIQKISNKLKEIPHSGWFKKGYKHSDETLSKMSAAKQGDNNPCFGRAGEQHPMFGKPKPEGSGRPSQQIEVLDLDTDSRISYDSIAEAARALNIHYTVISKYFLKNQQKPYKNRYIFKKL